MCISENSLKKEPQIKKSKSEKERCYYWIKKKKRTCKFSCVPHSRVCKRHIGVCVHPKPSRCAVCYEDFTIKDFPLGPCGHWIHMTCIYKSCKDTCPLCRSEINFTPNQKKQFDKHVVSDRITNETNEVSEGEQNEVNDEIQIINNGEINSILDNILNNSIIDFEMLNNRLEELISRIII